GSGSDRAGLQEVPHKSTRLLPLPVPHQISFEAKQGHDASQQVKQQRGNGHVVVRDNLPLEPNRPNLRMGRFVNSLLMMKAGKHTIGTQFLVALAVAALLVSTAAAQKPKRKKSTSPPPQPTLTAKEVKELNEVATQSRENLISASNTYRESLERL